MGTVDTGALPVKGYQWTCHIQDPAHPADTLCGKRNGPASVWPADALYTEMRHPSLYPAGTLRCCVTCSDMDAALAAKERDQ